MTGRRAPGPRPGESRRAPGPRQIDQRLGPGPRPRARQRALGPRRVPSGRLLAAPLALGALLVLAGVRMEGAILPATTGSVAFALAPAAGAGYQSEPIAVEATMVGASFDGPPSAAVWVRASGDGREWGAWTELHFDPDHAPDGASLEAGPTRFATDPLWVGEVRFIQFRAAAAEPGLRAEFVETAGRGLSPLQRMKIFFSRITIGRSTPAQAQPDQPAIMPRASWGGDQCVIPDHYHYNRRVQVMFVHHTGPVGSSSSGYSQAEVPQIIQALCRYHTQTQGWDDLAYNFLIDRFGTVWEGRGGGMDQAVQGAHTAGFNTYSTGVALIGDHRFALPSPAAQDALTRLAAWKLDLDHVDPNSLVTVTARAGSSKYPEGTFVTLPAIAGHRDASVTSCPGEFAYSLLPGLRPAVTPLGGAKIYGGWPATDPIEGLPDTSYIPTPFTFRFTEAMSWDLSIRDQTGALLLNQQGAGMDGAVAWDGRSNGTNLPVADYLVELSAVPTSGAPPPRPARFAFQLGSYLPPFSDDEDSVHEADIGFVYDHQITRGCAPTVFCPHEPVTRWQMALFLTRAWVAAGRPLPVPGATFTDTVGLPADQVAAVEQLRQLGIAAGTSATTFAPAGTVTRAHMALFLTRLLAQAGYGLPPPSDQGYIDLGPLPADQQAAINQIRSLGITLAVGTYEPEQNVSRAQMGSFLARTLRILGVTS